MSVYICLIQWKDAIYNIIATTTYSKMLNNIEGLKTQYHYYTTVSVRKEIPISAFTELKQNINGREYCKTCPCVYVHVCAYVRMGVYGGGGNVWWQICVFLVCVLMSVVSAWLWNALAEGSPEKGHCKTPVLLLWNDHAYDAISNFVQN